MGFLSKMFLAVMPCLKDSEKGASLKPSSPGDYTSEHVEFLLLG